MALKATSPTGRPRQERAVQTHDRILVGAATVFERVGYSTATLQDIATEVKVSTGALYAHYRSKADLVSAIMLEEQARSERLFEGSARWGLSPLERLERLVMQLAQAYRSDAISKAAVRLRDDYYNHLNGSLQPPSLTWATWISTVLQEGQVDGTISPTIDCDAVARILVASFYGVQDVSNQTTGREDLAERVQEWWQLMSPRLAGEPAHRGDRTRRKRTSRAAS